ncbi:MAG: ABC transporter ATP-binding protein [Verrucomicrobiales bacterium]|nr:ABC transporter ATP-binding protein [Verrucomicrobiales bacterium]
MAAIELKHVVKSYREPGGEVVVPVLKDIQLTVAEGESVAITGPSGCGKSTLLNLAGTLDQPDSGEVWVDGAAVQGCGAAELARLRGEKIGFIFQLHHLMPQCTVLENVLLPTLALKGAGDGAARARAEELLERVGLKDRRGWRPAQLSGGERQRVAVVRALINQPKVILADEPTGALDEDHAAALTDLLLELQRGLKVSLVLVTHHPAQARRMDRVLRMHEGSLREVTSDAGGSAA